LLWKDTFTSSSNLQDDSSIANDEQPWKSWPRPPGGFLDFG
jgi:tRNASer (uridine44-2'-O)-methyltransferase